jgi:hypothetical protein
MKRVLSVLAFAVVLPAQDSVLQRVDGTRVAGRLARITTDRATREAVMAAGGQEQRIPFGEVLALHGLPPAAERETPQAVVLLEGGDRLEGELRGGDEGGERVRVATRALGEVEIAVDRLQRILFPRAAPGITAAALTIPDGAGDEALFQRAGAGVDVVLGGIHRFTPRGVAFEWAEARDKGKPQLYPYDKLAGVALRGSLPPKQRAECQLVTRAGDVLGVVLHGAADGRLEVGWEGGRLRVALTDVACLTVLDGAGSPRTFLSDLEPARVEERGPLTVLGEPAPPLYRWQRDRTATGAFLEGGGLCHGKGLGVHSRAALTWRVPAERARFFALVALSEEPFAGEVRGQVDVTVRTDGRALFEAAGLRGGQPPQAVGPFAVEPGTLLTLEVDFGKGLAVADRVNWLSAVFLP